MMAVPCRAFILLLAVRVEASPLSLETAQSIHRLSRADLEFGRMMQSQLMPLGVELRSRSELQAHDGDRFVNVAGDGGGVLVAQALLRSGAETDRDPEGTAWPKSLVKVLASTARYARRHNYTHMVRTSVATKVPPWLEKMCRVQGLFSRGTPMDKSRGVDRCYSENYRDIATWEKMSILHDYLESSKRHYSHVLFIDTDATFVHPERDTVRELVELMDRQNRSLLAADENWRPAGNGPRNVNTGVMMVRNTEYARTLLRKLLEAHQDPYTANQHDCRLNEQRCLSMFIGTGKACNWGHCNWVNKEHILIMEGMRYNRHPVKPCVLTRKSDQDCNTSGVDIVHFMGSSKGATNTEDLLHGL